MNALEFKNEMHQFIDNAYTEFEDFQSQIMEMYSIFHDICMKNGIHCYYAFGSLLGVVRDKCMIPWDADVDVVIPVNQALKLIEVLQEQLPKDYYIVSNFIDKNYYLCESRICRKGFNPDVLHIDIFYLIGAPSDPSKLMKFDDKVRKMYYHRAIRYQSIEKGSTSRTKLVYYAKKIIKIFMHIEPNFLFNKRCNKMLFQYDFAKSDYCIVWATGGEIFPVNIFEPAQEYKLGQYKCLLPHNPEAFLRIRYSDFENYLPISDRFEEFYAGYKRLSFLRK